MKFAKNALQIITGIGACLTLCAGKAMALTVQEGAEIARAEGMPAELIGDNGVFTHITSIALAIVGALSVIMLIWGGVRYIISGGDSKKITDAKNTILYAIIGLVIAVFAYAIVRFVLVNVLGVPASSEEAEQSLLLLTQFIA